MFAVREPEVLLAERLPVICRKRDDRVLDETAFFHGIEQRANFGVYVAHLTRVSCAVEADITMAG